MIISAPRVLTGTDDLGPGWVRIEGPTFAALGRCPAPAAVDVQLPAGVLVPGLVDAQVNGAFGADLAGADPKGWSDVARALPATGVTSFVPTFITAPVSELCTALHRVSALQPALDADPTSARVLGVHVEGPFLAENRRGAHRRRLLAAPTPDAVDALVAAGRGVLLYVTLAPELPGGLDAVARLVAAGVRVAVGHSDAPADVVHAAAGAGATLVTHLFNAQRPLRHREPGVAGAALVDDRLTCGLIVDGHHVHPTAVRIAFTCKPGRIMLVTDAVAALGMPAGRYVLGGQEIVVRDGEPPRRDDGTIAGAATRLDDMIGRTVAAGVPLRSAVEAATRVPAQALGRPTLGRIAPGGPADLVWLAPDGAHRLRARATWIGGCLVHGGRLHGGRQNPPGIADQGFSAAPLR